MFEGIKLLAPKRGSGITTTDRGYIEELIVRYILNISIFFR